MAFTLEAIREAHSQFTGVDFPKLIEQFKLMGMETNTFNLQTGVVTYVHTNGEQLEAQGKAVEVPVRVTSSIEVGKDVLKRHQTGETDFPTFCVEMAEAGVCKWISDMRAMKCSYYDLAGNAIIVETIPSV
jgi:uncharacterized protein YbcV (DUF1398 family)